MWYENGGRTLQMNGNTVGQVCGGYVVKVYYEPWLGWRRRYPVRLEVISPEYFIGVPEGSNYYDLLDGWVLRTSTAREAVLNYGYAKARRDGDTVQLIEHWRRDSFEITVNGQVVSFRGRRI